MRGWTKVEESLPPKEKKNWSFSKDCIVRIGRKKRFGYYHWDDHEWYDNTTRPVYEKIEGVTHWQFKDEKLPF